VPSCAKFAIAHICHRLPTPLQVPSFFLPHTPLKNVWTLIPAPPSGHPDFSDSISENALITENTNTITSRTLPNNANGEILAITLSP
jgi:hypothetical protein